MDIIQLLLESKDFAGSKIDKGYDFEMIVDAHMPFHHQNSLEYTRIILKEQGLNPKEMYQKTLISGGVWKADIKHHVDNFIGEKKEKNGWKTVCRLKRIKISHFLYFIISRTAPSI